MYYQDFEAMIYGEDGENPLKPTVVRCLQEAKDEGSRMRVDIRIKPLGTTSTKSEHQFVCDSEEEHADTIIGNIKTRLDAAPGEGFEGMVRLNFYSSANSAIKYGSFTRQIRTNGGGIGNEYEPQGAFGGLGGGNMGGLGGGMLGGGNGPSFDFDDDDDDYGDEPSGGHNNNIGGGGFDHNQMMQVMQMMQSQQGANGTPVDQKMAMEWLNHTMSFLFRSLAQQMSMFERSTKLVETYAMRFGLPQPLEKPSAERIIREVPMEFEIPDYPQAQMQQQAPEKPSMLPQILNAAAAFAGNPGAAQLLQTAATMLTPAPTPAPQVPQQPQTRTVKPRPRYEEVEDGKPVRHVKQRPPQPKQPVPGADDWEPSEDEGGDFSFGLDGTHNQIDPFAKKNDMFASFESADDEMDFEIGGFGDTPEEEDSFGDGEFFQEEDEGFPDLTGMSPEEMKQTVIEWVNADPANRKEAVRAMLPDLASIIM
jgi:hypothetical protein